MANGRKGPRKTIRQMVMAVVIGERMRKLKETHQSIRHSL
jgi:hypothetical protein